VQFGVLPNCADERSTVLARSDYNDGRLPSVSGETPEAGALPLISQIGNRQSAIENQ